MIMTIALVFGAWVSLGCLVALALSWRNIRPRRRERALVGGPPNAAEADVRAGTGGPPVIYNASGSRRLDRRAIRRPARRAMSASGHDPHERRQQ